MSHKNRHCLLHAGGNVTFYKHEPELGSAPLSDPLNSLNLCSRVQLPYRILRLKQLNPHQNMQPELQHRILSNHLSPYRADKRSANVKNIFC